MLGLAGGFVLLFWMYEHPVARVFTAWAAVAFFLVAMAYLLQWPALFGKRKRGNLSPLSIFVLFPFLALQWLAHHGQRLLSREDAYNSIYNGLILGRRLTSAEQRGVQVAAVLDLTAEWSECRPYRELSYLCLPMLDKTVASDELMERGIAFICEKLRDGPVYVHCAQGHGRSGCMVAAVLVVLGVAPTPEAALEIVRLNRPGAKPSRAQAEGLADFLRKYMENNTPGPTGSGV